MMQTITHSPRRKPPCECAHKASRKEEAKLSTTNKQFKKHEIGHYDILELTKPVFDYFEDVLHQRIPNF
jgi:hypothetical protein